MKRDNNWTGQFRSRLSEAEAKVPEGLFADIESEMASRGLEPGMPVSHDSGMKRRLLWLPAAAAAVASLLLVSRKWEEDTSAFTGPQIAVLPENTSREGEQPNSILADAGAVTDRDFPQPMETRQTALETFEPKAVPLQPVIPTREAEPDKVSGAKNGEDPRVVRESREDERHERIPEFIEDDFSSRVGRESVGKNRKRLKMTAGLSASGTVTFASRGTASMVLPFQSPSTMMHPGSAVGTESFKVMDHTAETNEMYSQPVKFGVHVGFEISEWFRLSTGLTYSYLHSKSAMEIGNNKVSTKQNLHFMGLPLNLQFRLFEIGFFSAYANAGAAMEGLVSGTRNVSTALDNMNRPQSERLRDHTVYFSVNAGLGLNFKVAGPLNIYLEPGVGYYFRNNSVLKTIYSEKPLNFNLNVGLRFDI